MTQEALKLALEALEKNTKHLPADFDYHFEAITAIKEALAQTQEPVAVYGYCPECGAKGVMRERRPNGNDKCANGHTYPSSTSTPPQRTWVGLTDEERIEIDHLALSRVQAVQMTEAKLKEKNT